LNPDPQQPHEAQYTGKSPEDSLLIRLIAKHRWHGMIGIGLFLITLLTKIALSCRVHSPRLMITTPMVVMVKTRHVFGFGLSCCGMHLFPCTLVIFLFLLAVLGLVFLGFFLTTICCIATFEIIGQLEIVILELRHLRGINHKSTLIRRHIIPYPLLLQRMILRQHNDHEGWAFMAAR
jgi:hypothetical protein